MRAVTCPFWSAPRGCGPGLGPRARCPHGGQGSSSPAVTSAPPSLSRPAPGRSDGSPGACCFHLSGVANPLCSLHPWDSRVLSCLLPFWILIGFWGLWHLDEHPPSHLLEPALCSNSPSGDTKVLAACVGGWPDTPLPLTLRLKSQDLTVTFTRPWVYSNTWDSTRNALIHLGIIEMWPGLPWQWLRLTHHRADSTRGCVKSCRLHLKHHGRGCCSGTFR